MRRARIASLALALSTLGCVQSGGPPEPDFWKPIDAGPGMWIRHGPILLSVEEVRRDSVPLQDSGEHPAFVVTTRARFVGDRHVDSVSLLPFQPSGPTPGRGDVLLEDESGRRYAPLAGFEKFVDRRTSEVRLDHDQTETQDLLVFDPAAADAESLTITIPSLCRARDEFGQDTAQPLDRPPFRFRLLRWMWERK